VTCHWSVQHAKTVPQILCHISCIIYKLLNVYIENYSKRDMVYKKQLDHIYGSCCIILTYSSSDYPPPPSPTPRLNNHLQRDTYKLWLLTRDAPTFATSHPNEHANSTDLPTSEARRPEFSCVLGSVTNGLGSIPALSHTLNFL
jgi:hypothetical protein